MDDQNLDLDFEDLGGEAADLEADTEVFYWALKGALERTQLDLPPTQMH